MAQTHWDEERLGCFVRGELARSEMKQLVRHLIGGCASCEEGLRPWMELARHDHPVDVKFFELDGYEAAIERACEGASRAIERRERRSVENREIAVDARMFGLRGIPLVHELLQQSFDSRYRAPWEMWRLAYLARLVADSLDSAYLGPQAVADAQASAWAELGNAYRVIDEFDDADSALTHAESCLMLGSKSKVLLARIVDLRASLCYSTRQLPEAIALLGAVFEIHLELGNSHLAGRALSSKGLYLQYAGRSVEAKRVLLESLELLDATLDPQLVVSTRQCLLRALVEAGEYHEAARLFLRSGLAKDLAAEPLNLIRLRWLEGQIFAGLGKRNRAEACFAGVRQEFLEGELRYDAGLVGLDLAAVWLELGRTNEAAELAREILGTFRELGVEPEAVRALEFLEKACARAIATSLIVRRVSRFLQLLEHQPKLRFQGL